MENYFTKHNRHSLRLEDYDYTSPGAYFVTICVNKQVCLFGNIEDEKMHMNEAGKMVRNWWCKISEKFDLIKLNEYTIMPDHLHGILFIVGADPCVCSKHKPLNMPSKGEHTGSPLQRDVSLSNIMQWFKTMTTNEYIRNVKHNDWKPFHERL